MQNPRVKDALSALAVAVFGLLLTIVGFGGLALLINGALLHLPPRNRGHLPRRL